MFSVLMEDTEVGGHFVGMWLIPMFTTRKITLLGINHRISLAPTTVTQTNNNPADLLLLDISVSVCTLFEQMSLSQCVCILQKCITVCTYPNVVDISIVLQHSCTAKATRITSHSCVCWNYLCRCPCFIHSSLPMLCIAPSADAGCLRCFSGLAALGIIDAWGCLNVWGIFLHPRAETIWRAPDMAMSVSKSQHWQGQLGKKILALEFSEV